MYYAQQQFIATPSALLIPQRQLIAQPDIYQCQRVLSDLLRYKAQTQPKITTNSPAYFEEKLAQMEQEVDQLSRRIENSGKIDKQEQSDALRAQLQAAIEKQDILQNIRDDIEVHYFALALVNSQQNKRNQYSQLLQQADRIIHQNKQLQNRISGQFAPIQNQSGASSTRIILNLKPQQYPMVIASNDLSLNNTMDQTQPSTQINANEEVEDVSTSDTDEIDQRLDELMARRTSKKQGEKKKRGRPSVNGRNIRLEHVFKQQIYRGLKRAVTDQFFQFLRSNNCCLDDNGRLNLKAIKQQRKIVVKNFLEQYLQLDGQDDIGRHYLTNSLPLVYDILTNNDLRLFNKKERAFAAEKGWEGQTWYKAFIDIRNNACQNNITQFLKIDIISRLWHKAIQNDHFKLHHMFQAEQLEGQMDPSLDASCRAVTQFFHNKLEMPLPQDWQSRFF